jgi:hypothetical protein
LDISLAKTLGYTKELMAHGICNQIPKLLDVGKSCPMVVQGEAKHEYLEHYGKK